MIRRYCDVCGEEIKRNYVDQRLIRHLNEWRIEIIVGHKDLGWNNGDICLKCLLNIVQNGTENQNTYSKDLKEMK